MRLYDLYIGCLLLLSSYMSRTYAQSDENFTLCVNQKTCPYYNPELKYQGGFWEIKNHFLTNYPENEFASLPFNSGLVTIQFVVNCNGQTGKFNTQSCDLSYESTDVNNTIISHLLALTKQLDQWIPAKDDHQNTVNSHTFLSFRIENGKIIEILPK